MNMYHHLDRIPEDKGRFSSLAFLSFILGCVATVFAMNLSGSKVPEAMMLEKDGKEVGYADFNTETSEVVYLSGKGVQSPGMFICFPIYGNNLRTED